METIRFYDATGNQVCSDTEIHHFLTDSLSVRMMGVIAKVIEESSEWLDWMIPPIDGDAYDCVDALLVRSVRTGKWKPAPKYLRTDIYQAIHFTK